MVEPEPYFMSPTLSVTLRNNHKIFMIVILIVLNFLKNLSWKIDFQMDVFTFSTAQDIHVYMYVGTYVGC